MIRKNDDTEQRALIAILLSLVVFYVWTSTYGPKPPPPGEAAPEATPSVEVPVPTGAPEVPAEVPTVVPERRIDVATAELTAALASRWGGLTDVVLPNHSAAYKVTPLWTYAFNRVTGRGEPEWKPYGEQPGAEDLIGPDGAMGVAGVGPFMDGDYLVDGAGNNYSARRETREGIAITKRWSLTDDPRLVKLDVTFENRGNAAWTGPLWVGAADVFTGEVGQYSSAMRPQGVADGDLETLLDLDDADEGAVVEPGPVSWLGMGDRYFLAAMMPEDTAWGTLTFARSAEPALAGQPAYGAYLVRNATLAPGQAEGVSLQVYMGGKDQHLLEPVGHDLDKSVDLGFFGFFSKILLVVLQGIHAITNNWGLSIILLTLLVKVLFFPLTQRSFVSGRKMQALNPKMQELREKYKDDPQAMGQAQMQLFKDEGVNPLAGCLPMLVQMPVWFALFSVLLYTSDLYHAQFFYLKDLTSVDPIGVLPVLYGALMIIQMQLTPTSPNMDPAQQRIMKLMPLMFSFFAFIFPSGLALYMLVNALLSITQMWFINRKYPLPQAATTA